MAGISVNFGSTQALDGVNLNIRRGTIHAVVGENGAGKTTLMRCLAGSQKPSAGTIEVDGEVRVFDSPQQAREAGIGMVSQHLGIVPGLTVLENMVLGDERGRKLDLLSAGIEGEALAESLGFEFKWLEDAVNLPPSSAQKLEILKLLWRQSRVMILDEPTSMLSPLDSEALFRQLRELVSGGSTVILVTHRLADVIHHCDGVTVLRGGKLVAELEVGKNSATELARLMIGSESAAAAAEFVEPGEVRLRVRDLVVRNDDGLEAVSCASFDVRAGEVVGIAGVDGNGQRELIEALFGLLPVESGSMDWEGRRLEPLSTRSRIGLGFRIIVEDRHLQAVVEDWDLEANGALGLHREEAFAAGGWVKASARHTAATQMAERFATRHSGVGASMKSLSGGNQQRFVAARALHSENVSLLLAIQPARGLDFAATETVYRGIREACERGACALIVGYDLYELQAFCSRILVMFKGRVLEARNGSSREEIGRLMVGS